MSNARTIILCLIFGAMSYSLSAFADPDHSCQLRGSYGYLYTGTSYPGGSTVPFTETGYFAIKNGGNVIGEGVLALNFSNFAGSGQPLWLLVNESQSNGTILQKEDNHCAGTIQFLATWTVAKTSNPSLVPEGTVLFTDSPRSIAYTVSGSHNEVVDMISTSPGTIASGTAHRSK